MKKMVKQLLTKSWHNEEFPKSGDYQSGSFVYVGHSNSTFYEATELIDEYNIFSGEY